MEKRLDTSILPLIPAGIRSESYPSFYEGPKKKFYKLQTYTDNNGERTRQRAAVIDRVHGLKDLHIKKTTVTNIKETMTTNDDKSRPSLSGCHVAVDDVAPGWPSFTVTWCSRVIVDVFGCVIAECSGVSLLTCSSMPWSLGGASDKGGWIQPLMMVVTLGGHRRRRWWHLDFI